MSITKKSQKALIAIFSVCFVAFLAMFLVFGNGQNKTFAAESGEQETFRMLDGAAVRLKEEDTDFGIRFGAAVVDTQKTYNMLIVPEVLVNVYDASQTDKNIVDYLIETYGEEKLSIAKGITPNVNKEVYGSIVNVLWNNLNRKFAGFAYYKDGNTTVVATKANDAYRSVNDVCERAIASGLYDEDSVNKAILVNKLRQTEKQAAGYSNSDVYIYEDFEYYKTSEKYTTSVSSDTSVVDIKGEAHYTALKVLDSTVLGSGKGLQFVPQRNGYDSLDLDFGSQPAATYEFSFKLKDDRVGEATGKDTLFSYADWEITRYNPTSEKYDIYPGKAYANYYVGNNTFKYYFTTTSEAKVAFGIVAKDAANGFNGDWSMVIDEVCLRQVDKAEEKTYSSLIDGKVLPMTDMPSPFMDVVQYGINRSGTVTTTCDPETNGVTITGTGANSEAIRLGKLDKGIYKLSANITTTGTHQALMMFTRISSYTKANYAGTNLNDWGGATIFETANKKNDNGTYEWILDVTENQSDLALRVYSNSGDSVTIKDIGLEKLDLSAINDQSVNTMVLIDAGKTTKLVKVLHLGNVTQGAYRLSYNLVPNATNCTKEMGFAAGTLTTNAKSVAGTLDNLAYNKTGNTYSFIYNVYETYEDLKAFIYLTHNNTNNQTIAATLDNVTFEELDYSTSQVVNNFEGGLIKKTGHWVALHANGQNNIMGVNEAFATYNNSSAIAVVNDTDTNKCLKITLGATNQYTRFNYVVKQTGTYRISLKVKSATITSMQIEGKYSPIYKHPYGFGWAINDGAIMGSINDDKTITSEWTVISTDVVVTTENTCFSVGLRNANTTGDVYMDDITIQKIA